MARLPRQLCRLPWYHDGSSALSVLVTPDVPPSDDSMIRAALVRGAISCRSVAQLERALNREFWQIGYVARLQPDPGPRGVVLVEVSTSY
jgi:hypothetical protein